MMLSVSLNYTASNGRIISEKETGMDLVRSYSLICSTILVFAWRDCGKQ
jgi:hypothetical protein